MPHDTNISDMKSQKISDRYYSQLFPMKQSKNYEHLNHPTTQMSCRALWLIPLLLRIIQCKIACKCSLFSLKGAKASIFVLGTVSRRVDITWCSQAQFALAYRPINRGTTSDSVALAYRGQSIILMCRAGSLTEPD